MCPSAFDSWITKVKRVLLVDLSNCLADEFEKLVRQVPDYVTTQSRGSVLVLTDFTAAVFNRDTISARERNRSVRQALHQEVSSWGTGTFPMKFYEELKSFSPERTSDFSKLARRL